MTKRLLKRAYLLLLASILLGAASVALNNPVTFAQGQCDWWTDPFCDEEEVGIGGGGGGGGVSAARCCTTSHECPGTMLCYTPSGGLATCSESSPNYCR